MTIGQQLGQSAFGVGMGMLNSFTGQSMQMNQQNQFNRDQINNQMGLTRFNNAMALDLWKKTGVKGQVEEMRKAGLNISAMYNKGGGGGGIASVTPGNAPGGNADRPNPIEGMAMVAQVRKMNAEADLAEANANKAKEETTTEVDTRPYLVENMKQSGITQWYENLKSKYLREGHSGEDVTILKHKLFGTAMEYGEQSPEAQKFQQDLFTSVAQAKNLDANTALTNEKEKNYWKELLIAQQNADSNTVEAIAKKLAIEHQTGEFTNWKTWVDLGLQALGAVKDIVKIPSISKAKEAGMRIKIK